MLEDVRSTGTVSGGENTPDGHIVSSLFSLPRRVGRLLLASGSPRRVELLREEGFDPIVAPQDVDETPRPGEAPTALVERLARLKATTALAQACPGDLVLAADTTVAIGDEDLGKPVDENDARRMLRLLSGATHQVSTGVCLAMVGTDANAACTIGVQGEAGGQPAYPARGAAGFETGGLTDRLTGPGDASQAAENETNDLTDCLAPQPNETNNQVERETGKATGQLACPPSTRAVSFVETTQVTFYELSDAEIDAYVRTGEPLDKAGSYGIQGLGRLLVRGIEGDYFNVVGLPVARTMREMTRLLGTYDTSFGVGSNANMHRTDTHGAGTSSSANTYGAAGTSPNPATHDTSA